MDPDAPSPDGATVLIAAAREHEASGRFEEAETGYRRALDVEPDNPEAAHRLGALLLRKKALDEALPLLARAAAAPGAAVQARADHFRALLAARRFAQAEAWLRQAGDDLPRARMELLLRQHWGMGLLQAGDALAAEAQLQRAAELAPADADAQADLGFVRLRLARYPAAEQALRAALRTEPGHVAARINLGSTLKALEQWDEAASQYRQALADEPANAAALANLGALLINRERHAEALACAEAAAEAQPAQAALLRARALEKLGRYDEALAACAAAEAGGADRYEALVQRGAVLARLGRYAEALAAFDAAVDLGPDGYLAQHHRALVRLMTGDFAGGWPDYEFRWRNDAFLASSGRMAPPELRRRFDLRSGPSEIAGRRVLLVAEQGVGDQIMFASMIPDLAAAASEVTCVCERRLARLFSNSIAGVRFLWPGEAQLRLSDFDVVLPLGSLGRLFRTRAADFPGTAFLGARPGVRTGWAARLGDRPPGTLRIGLSWRGGTPGTRASERSMPLKDLAACVGGPGRELVSLQYGDTEAEVAAVNAELGAGVRWFPREELDDFEAFAGLVQSLDLVVSVQNTTVHAAGAVGAPCLALLPGVPEWRYMAQGERMPWYRSVRLFRQLERGDWTPVLREVAEAVAAFP